MPYNLGICVGLAGFVIDLSFNGNGDPYEAQRDGKLLASQLLGQRILARHFLRYPVPHICSTMRKSSLRNDWDRLCFLTHDVCQTSSTRCAEKFFQHGAVQLASWKSVCICVCLTGLYSFWKTLLQWILHFLHVKAHASHLVLSGLSQRDH